MIVPPYQPRVTTWQDLPEAADPETAQGDQVLRAADVNGWQAQLSLVSDAVNSNHYGLAGLTGSVSVLTEQQPKGTMLAHDGTAWTGQTGGYGQVLTPDTSSPTGASWLRPLEKHLSVGAVEHMALSVQHPQTPAGSPALPPQQGIAGHIGLYPAIDGWVYATHSGIWVGAHATYTRPGGYPSTLTTTLGTLPPGVRPVTDQTPEAVSVADNAWIVHATNGLTSTLQSTSKPEPSLNAPPNGLSVVRSTQNTYHKGIVAVTIGANGVISVAQTESNSLAGWKIALFVHAGHPLWRWRP